MLKIFDKIFITMNENNNPIVGTGTDNVTPVFTSEETTPTNVEPKLTICRDNTHRKGFFAPVMFIPVDTKVAIQLHLNDLAFKDETFKACLNKEEKSFDECVKYIEQRIFSEMVRQAGGMDALRDGSAHIDGAFAKSCQFSDEDTYRLAEYYFRDDSIEQEKKRKAELAEKKRIREEQRKAIEKATQKGKKTSSSTIKPVTTSSDSQATEKKQPQELSLFDF